MSRIIFKVICLVFFLMNLVNAQQDDFLYKSGIDSNSVPKNEIDTSIVFKLLSKSKESIDKNPAQSMEYAQQALSLSEDLNFDKGKSESLRRIGIYYMFHAEYNKGLEVILKALTISEKLDDKLLIAKCLMNLGGIYYDLREYNTALDYFSKSLIMAKKIKDNEIISGCLTNMANVYNDLGNYKSALNNYEEALQINTAAQDKQGISTSFFNIGNVYFYQKNYKTAEYYYIKSLKIKREIDDKSGIIICLNNIGKLYLKINNYDKAIKYCAQSLDLAREIDSMDDIRWSSFALSLAYKKKGDYKTSLAYFELGSTVKDSIFNETKNKELGNLQSQYELEKQNSQIILLKKDNDLKDAQSNKQLYNRNLIIGGILLLTVLIISVIQFQNNKREKKINQQLLSQNKEIEAKSEALEIANEELDNFIYRSSHDLKAPLTSVLGLISISKLQFNEATIVEYLNKMQVSIDKLLLVIQDLSNYSRNSRMKILNEEIDFRSVVSKSLENLKDIPKFDSINFTQQISGTIPFYSDSLRIGILINNLLSNAIVHCSTENSISIVSIIIEYSEEKALIKITDNGCGIPDDVQPNIFEMFYKGSNESLGSGLGLYIVKGVIKKLNGSIDFVTAPDCGTTFIVEIPKQKQILLGT